jgi:hypothetical protein
MPKKRKGDKAGLGRKRRYNSEKYENRQEEQKKRIRTARELWKTKKERKNL